MTIVSESDIAISVSLVVISLAPTALSNLALTLSGQLYRLSLYLISMSYRR